MADVQPTEEPSKEHTPEPQPEPKERETQQDERRRNSETVNEVNEDRFEATDN